MSPAPSTRGVPFQRRAVPGLCCHRRLRPPELKVSPAGHTSTSTCGKHRDTSIHSLLGQHPPRDVETASTLPRISLFRTRGLHCGSSQSQRGLGEGHPRAPSRGTRLLPLEKTDMPYGNDTRKRVGLTPHPRFLFRNEYTRCPSAEENALSEPGTGLFPETPSEVRTQGRCPRGSRQGGCWAYT